MSATAATSWALSWNSSTLTIVQPSTSANTAIATPWGQSEERIDG